VQLAQLPDDLGRLERLPADTGHCSKNDMRGCEQVGITPVIAIKRV
jgi:hypothetical protein